MSERAAARGLWSDAGRRLTGNRLAFAALAAILVTALFAVLAPLLSPWGYDSLDWQHLAQPPGHVAAHWFGTDRLGRDLFVRTLYGVRLSLLISVLASLVSLVIGVAWGAVAGLARAATPRWKMALGGVVLFAPGPLFLLNPCTLLPPRPPAGLLLARLRAAGVPHP